MYRRGVRRTPRFCHVRNHESLFAVSPPLLYLCYPSFTLPLLLRATDQPCLDNLVVTASALYIYILFDRVLRRAASTAATIVMQQEHFCRSAPLMDPIRSANTTAAGGCDTLWRRETEAPNGREKYILYRTYIIIG